MDSFAGGFVVQAFVAYWFQRRFGVSPSVLGAIFFGANLLAGLSALMASRVARRIGLLATMVATHIPSNVLLFLVPLMPSLPLAIAVLLLRFSISQMDVPTRQAYTMALVPAGERSAAAGVTGIARTVGASLFAHDRRPALRLRGPGQPALLARGRAQDRLRPAGLAHVQEGEDREVLTEVVVDLAFSPLFHISNGGLELVMGPKLGAFGVSASTKNPSGASGGANGQGLSYGGNLGIFGAVGNLAVGGLVGFTGRRLTKACVTPPGATETCDTSPGGYDLKVFSITGAVLF
jgi:hypothetical protein